MLTVNDRRSHSSLLCFSFEGKARGTIVKASLSIFLHVHLKIICPQRFTTKHPNLCTDYANHKKCHPKGSQNNPGNSFYSFSYVQGTSFCAHAWEVQEAVALGFIFIPVFQFFTVTLPHQFNTRQNIPSKLFCCVLPFVLSSGEHKERAVRVTWSHRSLTFQRLFHLSLTSPRKMVFPTSRPDSLLLLYLSQQLEGHAQFKKFRIVATRAFDPHSEQKSLHKPEKQVQISVFLAAEFDFNIFLGIDSASVNNFEKNKQQKLKRTIINKNYKDGNDDDGSPACT